MKTLKTRSSVMVVVTAAVGLILLVPGPCMGGNYGAIAYSQSTGCWGYSYNYGSRQAAISEALRRCGESDCQWKVWFKNSCGALAKAENGALGWSWGADSRAEAEARALEECESRGSNCEIICWACTSR
jgi:serine/threonine-protein kinase